MKAMSWQEDNRTLTFRVHSLSVVTINHQFHYSSSHAHYSNSQTQLTYHKSDTTGIIIICTTNTNKVTQQSDNAWTLREHALRRLHHRMWKYRPWAQSWRTIYPYLYLPVPRRFSAGVYDAYPSSFVTKKTTTWFSLLYNVSVCFSKSTWW